MTNGQPDCGHDLTESEWEAAQVESQREEPEDEEFYGPAPGSAVSNLDGLSVEELKARAERCRLEGLVHQVAGMILRRPCQAGTVADFRTWAEDLARNILAGLQGEKL
jgi:hypothetical protein